MSGQCTHEISEWGRCAACGNEIERDYDYELQEHRRPWLPVPGSTVRESDSGVRDSDSEESEGKA